MKRIVLVGACMAMGAVASPEMPQNGVVMELWDNVKSKQISEMLETNQNRPATAVYVKENIDAAAFGMDNFGVRYTAYLTPPSSGEYRFYLAADDKAELLLSSSEDASQLKKICEVARYMPRHNFVNGNASGTAVLQKGKKYLLVVHYMDLVNEDHVALAWEGPGVNKKRIIDAQYLTPQADAAVLKKWEATQMREKQTEELLASLHKQKGKQMMSWLNKLPPPDLKLLETKLQAVESSVKGKKNAQVRAILKPYVALARSIVATPKAPVTNIVAKRLLFMESLWLKSLSKKQLQKLGSHRLASSLGAIPSKTMAQEATVKLSSSAEKWSPELVSVGYYAMPGKPVSITIPSKLVGKNLEMQVGHHFSAGKKPLTSMPDTTNWYKLEKETTHFVTPHGGLLLLRVPKNVELQDTPISMKGVIAAPRFVLGKDTDKDWAKLKNNPAPWGELVSDHLILLASREALQTVKKPTALMTWWNENCRDLEDFFSYYPNIPFRMHCGHYAEEGISYWPLQWGENNMMNQLNLPRMKEKNSPLFLHEHGHHCDFWDMELSFWAESTTNWGGYYLKARKGKAFTWKDSHDKHLLRLFNPNDKAMLEIQQDKWYKISTKGTHHWSYPITSMMIGYAEDFGWECVKATIKRIRDKDGEMYKWSFVQGADADQAKIDRYLIGLSEAAKRDVRPYFAHFKMNPSAGAAKMLDNLKLPKWDATYLVLPELRETQKNKPLTIPASEDKLLSFAKKSKVKWSSTSTEGGSVEVKANGDVVYTPKSDFSGKDGIKYSLYNEYGKTVDKVLEITVQ